MDLLEVVYQGGEPRVTALLTGEVKFAMFDISLARDYVAAGQTRPFLSVGHRRQHVWPELPSFGDIGLTDFDYGIFRPCWCPPAFPSPSRRGYIYRARPPTCLAGPISGSTSAHFRVRQVRGVAQSSPIRRAPMLRRPSHPMPPANRS